MDLTEESDEERVIDLTQDADENENPGGDGGFDGGGGNGYERLPHNYFDIWNGNNEGKSWPDT